jgi:dephospho-CoA kinase
MTNIKMLAFVGMPFSGKSEAVKIAKEMGIPVIRMGDMIWTEVKKQGLELNYKNVGIVANKLRIEQGKEIWAKKTLEKIKSMGKLKSIVIDGIRNVEEIDYFKKNLGKNLKIIVIETSNKTRQKRALKRNRKDDSKNLKKIIERDKRELGWGLGAVIASADIIVPNEKNIKDFRNHIIDLLEEL